MGECYQCKHWNNAQYVMNKYGEGCGICMVDGQVRFCSHKCPFASPPDEEDEMGKMDAMGDQNGPRAR